MALLRQRDTGSVVNVPDEKVDQLLALGSYEKTTKTAAKTAAKKTSK